MKKGFLALSFVVVFGLVLSNVAQAGIYDPFNGPALDPAWQTYGNAPYVVSLADARLDLRVAGDAGITPQGLKRAAGFAPNWEYSVDVFNGEGGFVDYENIVSVDIGIHAGPVTRAMRLTNASLTDPANPDALDRTLLLLVFTGSEWVDTGYISTNDFEVGARNFKITSAGGFYVDGNLAFNMSSIAFSLDEVFISAGNYSDESYGTLADHVVSLDNVLITPEPTTLALLGLGAATLVVRRRR